MSISATKICACPVQEQIYGRRRRSDEQGEQGHPFLERWFWSSRGRAHSLLKEIMTFWLLGIFWEHHVPPGRGLSFPTCALGSGFSHAMAQNPPWEWVDILWGHPEQGKKMENPSGNGTTLPSNPTTRFPQPWVGAIPLLVLGWSIFTPWSSPALCSHILPLAVFLWKHQDLLFIPGVSPPPHAWPHACPGHFKSPFQPGSPLAGGLAGTTDSTDVSVMDWQGQDTDPGSPRDASRHVG